jgi:hypothetical protein
VREEALVFGGQDRVSHNGWDVGVLRNLPVLRGELDQRLAVGVVDVADGGELKAREWPELGQILPTEVDVVQHIDG